MDTKATDFDLEMLRVTDQLTENLRIMLQDLKNQNIDLDEVKIMWRNIPNSDGYTPTFLRILVSGWK